MCSLKWKAFKVSVPSPSDVQATFVATLMDEWILAGVTDAVVCPGSRSTPLALAVAARAEVSVHVRIDERSAAFFALGRALRTQRPVLIIVTSGTAAMELHAAIAEADLAGVPLIVITADRPPELHGVGAPQTVRQRELYGPLVRRFEEPGVARSEASSSWRPLARRMFDAATGVHPGPVHLNAAFIEPLVGVVQDVPAPRGAQSWRERRHTPTMWSHDEAGRRVLAVVGQGVSSDFLRAAERLEWVVLGDASVSGGVAHFDAILRSDAVAASLRPDVVIRTGGLPASKVLQQRLREWGAPTVGLTTGAPLADPDGLVSTVVSTTLIDVVASAVASSDYRSRWSEFSRRASRVVESFDGNDLDEPRLARRLVKYAAKNDIPLTVGSSMPVREIEWWATAHRGPIYANRGANGIDGVTSTALGVASGSRGMALVGDITFLHDVSALTDGMGVAGGSCAIVVANNGGGGIFGFLPQATTVDAADFEQLFLTPRHHHLSAIAVGFGHRVSDVATTDALDVALDHTWASPGLHVIVVQVPPIAQNVTRHQEINDAVVRDVEELL